MHLTWSLPCWMCHVVLEYLFNELKQSAMRKSRSRKKVPSFIVFLFYCGSLLSFLINDIANKANHFTIRDWPFPMHSPRHNTGNNVVCMLSYHYYRPEAIWTYIWSNHDHQRKQPSWYMRIIFLFCNAEGGFKKMKN